MSKLEFPVDISVAAKSKAFRMLQSYTLVDRVQHAGSKGQLFRLTHDGVGHATDSRSTFHLVTDEEGYVIVFEPSDDGTRLQIITQRHQHFNYRGNSNYETASPSDVRAICKQRQRDQDSESTSEDREDL